MSKDVSLRQTHVLYQEVLAKTGPRKMKKLTADWHPEN